MSKTLEEILSERQDARVIGINRSGHVMRLYDPSHLLQVVMTWHEDWQAWSVRLSRGILQQICVFTPVSEEVAA